MTELTAARLIFLFHYLFIYLFFVFVLFVFNWSEGLIHAGMKWNGPNLNATAKKVSRK